MSQYLLIYATFPDKASAQKATSLLLSQRLAACANLFDGMESHYWWQGKQESSREVAVFFKTASYHFEAAKEAILAVHPYSCPAIVALPVLTGHTGFLEWITKETTHEKK